MFEWKLEDLKLKDKFGFYDFDQIVKSTSKEDKLKFVDNLNDGKLTYLLNLSDKFNEDKENGTLKKDSYGYVKTVSLKAWLKRNDTRKMISNYYHYGQIYFLRIERYIKDLNRKGFGDSYDDFIDECFYRQLKDCQNKEIHYFRTHDEYEVMKREIKEKAYKYNTTFRVHISFCSNGCICIVNEEGKEREITKEECKFLLEQYKKLEDLIEDCTKKCTIKY